MSLSPVWLQSHYKQVWPRSFGIRLCPLSYVISKPCNCSEIRQIWFDVFFFPPPQLQHCLPMYLLFSRAHGQSSGGTQHHEPPPAPHHKLSGPAPPGCPGALFPWTEGCTQEPFWQGEAAPKPSTHPHFHPNNPFIPPDLKLLQYSDHLLYSWPYHQTLSGNTSAWKAL